MKCIHTLPLAASLLLAIGASAQVRYPGSTFEWNLNKPDPIIKKAKIQKTFAWILLGIGASIYTSQVISRNSKLDNNPIGYIRSGASENVFTGKVVGGFLMAASIPLFILSKKNKRSANFDLARKPAGLLIHIPLIRNLHGAFILLKTGNGKLKT